MKPALFRLGLMAAGILLTACSTTRRVAFEPRHLAVPVTEPARILAGKALVVMSPEEVGWIYEGRPSGWNRVMERTQFEVGEITRQAALKIGGAAFADGAEYRPDAAGAPPGAVVIRPKVNQFAYEWTEEELFGWSLVPVLELEMWIEIRDPGGRTLFDHTYRSGRVAGRIRGLVVSAQQMNAELARVFHATVARLLAQGLAEYAASVPAAGR